MNYRLIPMERAHLPQAAELERQCFSDPWTEAQLAGELDKGRLVAGHHQRPPGELRRLGFAGDDGIDIEAPAGKQAGHPQQHTGMVHRQDGEHHFIFLHPNPILSGRYGP